MAYDCKQLLEMFDSKVKTAKNAIDADYEIQALLDKTAENYRRDIGMYVWEIPGKEYTVPEKYDPMKSLVSKSDAIDRLMKLENIRKAVNELLKQDLKYHTQAVAEVRGALTAAAERVLGAGTEESAGNSYKTSGGVSQTGFETNCSGAYKLLGKIKKIEERT